MRAAYWLVIAGAVCAIAWAPPVKRGEGPATTVQLPTFGVAIDADGLLEWKVVADPTGRLRRERAAAAMARLDGDVVHESPMRKVSLVRLQRAIERLREGDQPPTEAMRYLVGLQRVQFVFCFPERGDIVIAGPAEGWVEDAVGRVVGIKTGRPVVRLEDLAAALRAFPPGERNRPFVGCTIDPTAEGLARLVAFQKTVPRSVAEREKPAVRDFVFQGLRDSLGMSSIRTFGVPAETHMARVMIEADYRMKLMCVGLEPPPIRMATYLDLIRSPKQSMLERWWFTPNYKCVRMTDDRLAAQLVGDGVQLLTENKRIATDGTIGAAPRANPAAERFAATFTAKYAELAAHRPIYAELRNAIDLLVAAGIMQRYDYYTKSDWSPALFADETAFPIATHPAPKHAPAAVNCIWRGHRLLAPAGGGVSIHPHRALDPSNLLPAEGELDDARDDVASPADDRWWWD